MKMRGIHLWAIVIVSLVLCMCAPLASAQKYAVLISAGVTTADDQMINSEYWYDMFFMYRTLIGEGFTHNTIFTLYGNGNDFNSANANYKTATFFPGVAKITDYPVTKTNVDNLFTWLANGNPGQNIPKLQPGDYLFFWWMGHGGSVLVGGVPEYSAFIATTGEGVADHDFATYLNRLPKSLLKSIFVMTCQSGGLIDDLQGLHTMLHTAAPYDHNAFSDNYDVVHAEFSYQVACALRELDPIGNPIPSDTDGNGSVTIRETNTYAHAHTLQSVTQISDYRAIAPLMRVADVNPVASVPNQGVMSRDHDEDSGIVPSDFKDWWGGPDLWVRLNNDGEETHQNPEFGQTNYVYARVHNIGANILNATADLSWSEVSTWNNPASWHPIASLPVNNFTSSESRVISSQWTDVPAPGHYCLHTVLNAPGDPFSGTGYAYMDNNLVQANVCVEDNVPGWVKNYFFLIENGSKKMAKIDLVIEPMNVLLFQSPVIRLKMPENLKFDRIIGGKLVRTEEGTVLEISSRTRKATIKGIVLDAAEAREAVLAVTLPAKMKLGQSFSVKVSEQLDGKKMGGVIFTTIAASQRTVLETNFERFNNFLLMADKKFNLKNSEEVSNFVAKAVQNSWFKDSRTLKEIVPSLAKLQFSLRDDFANYLEKAEFQRFEVALKKAQVAAEKNDLSLFVEAEEELMMATKPLFMRAYLKNHQ